ncbi:hypothetical protein ACFW91_28580 [Streptomyces asoensis]|uniref:hypothetical protein n=1 Tax=Streptomyces asoensis TaxID=249586 RepID=UPI0036A2D8EB
MSKHPPLGVSDTWETVMEPAGYQCQCTGGLCGSQHSKTGLRCIQTTTHGRLLVAPADLTLSPVAAAAVPAEQLRAWCHGCHAKAQKRQRDSQRELRRLEADELFVALPLWPDPSPALTSCTCAPPSQRSCGHCTHCDTCLDCTKCAGDGCTCECEGD